MLFMVYFLIRKLEMKKSWLLLLMRGICSVIACQETCASSLQEDLLKELHKTAVKPTPRRVITVDLEHSRIFLEPRSLYIREMVPANKSAFTAPLKNTTNVDLVSDN
jgi:hypothetical protein